MIALKDSHHNLNPGYFPPVLGTFSSVFCPENGDDRIFQKFHMYFLDHTVSGFRGHLEMNVWNHAHTETFVLALKRAISALDLMKSVVVSVAWDGMKSVAVFAGR
jgi:hypothetical protein